jgi:hypothetical protein
MMVLRKQRESLMTELRKLNPLFGKKGIRPDKFSPREKELTDAIDTINRQMRQVYEKNTPLPNRTRGILPDRP